jgi:hypothetical protein
VSLKSEADALATLPAMPEISRTAASAASQHAGTSAQVPAGSGGGSVPPAIDPHRPQGRTSGAQVSAPRSPLQALAPELLNQIMDDLSERDLLSLCRTSRAGFLSLDRERQQVALLSVHAGRRDTHLGVKVLLAGHPAAHPNLVAQLQEGDPGISAFPLPRYTDLSPGLKGKVLLEMAAGLLRQPPTHRSRTLDTLLEEAGGLPERDGYPVVLKLIEAVVHRNWREPPASRLSSVVTAIRRFDEAPRNELLRQLVLAGAQRQLGTSATIDALAPVLHEDRVGEQRLHELIDARPTHVLGPLRTFMQETLVRDEPQRSVALQLGLMIIGQAMPQDSRGQDLGGVGVRTAAFDVFVRALQGQAFDTAAAASLKQGLQVALRRVPAADQPTREQQIANLNLT